MGPYVRPRYQNGSRWIKNIRFNQAWLLDKFNWNIQFSIWKLWEIEGENVCVISNDSLWKMTHLWNCNILMGYLVYSVLHKVTVRFNCLTHQIVHFSAGSDWLVRIMRKCHTFQRVMWLVTFHCSLNLLFQFKQIKQFQLLPCLVIVSVIFSDIVSVWSYCRVNTVNLI